MQGKNYLTNDYATLALKRLSKFHGAEVIINNDIVFVKQSSTIKF